MLQMKKEGLFRRVLKVWKGGGDFKAKSSI